MDAVALAAVNQVLVPPKTTSQNNQAVVVPDNFFYYVVDNDYQRHQKGILMSNPICLRNAKENQRLKIITVDGNGELGRRIRDMGLIPGTEILVIGKAPLKDPVAIRLKDFTLTLRNSEADNIIVEPLED